MPRSTQPSAANEYAGGADFFDTPPLRYLGAKWMLADWIIQQFPRHENYVEPYAGSAAVFFRKRPSLLETLNDLDGEVVNFFRVLRERTDELLEAIDLTPYARAEYDLSFEPSADPLERARRFYVHARMSFGGYQRIKTGWRRQQAIHTRRTSVTREWCRMDGLLLAAARLKMAQIEQRPALDVIEQYDQPNTLFYVDPPYPRDSRSRSDKRYVHEATHEDHRALASVLRDIKGMAILSGYPCPLYDELFGDWRRLEKSTTTNGNGQATECLWLSPNITRLDALPMFGLST